MPSEQLIQAVMAEFARLSAEKREQFLAALGAAKVARTVEGVDLVMDPSSPGATPWVTRIPCHEALKGRPKIAAFCLDYELALLTDPRPGAIQLAARLRVVPVERLVGRAAGTSRISTSQPTA